MIIKTKSKKIYIHAKLIILYIFISIIPLGIGYFIGVAVTLNWVIDLGLHFVDLSPIIDEELFRQAVIQYKSSLGGWAFDPESPLFINGTKVSIPSS